MTNAVNETSVVESPVSDVDTMNQYTLDGKLAQTFLIPDDLEMLYINDEEIIVQKWKEDEPSVIYSIPIIQTGWEMFIIQ